jgi:hypothetical protein
MIYSRLEINIIYYSEQGREVLFTDLVNEVDVMDESHYDASNFWSIFGGFDVTINGYLTVFRSCSFYCLVKATSFLIHSLFWIKGRRSEWFDTDKEFPNEVTINPTPNAILKLQMLSESEILFSYTPIDPNYVAKRGDRYFKDIVININDWFEQTDIALSEYFKILSFVVAQASDSNRVREVMKEYLQVCKNVSTQ